MEFSAFVCYFFHHIVHEGDKKQWVKDISLPHPFDGGEGISFLIICSYFFLASGSSIETLDCFYLVRAGLFFFSSRDLHTIGHGILSKAFSRLIKQTWASLSSSIIFSLTCLRVKIWSWVLFPFLNPHWLSSNWCSTCSWSLVSRILAYTVVYLVHLVGRYLCSFDSLWCLLS